MSEDAPEGPLTDAAPPPVDAPAAPREVAAIDPIANFDDCALGHHGVLLDLGDATARAMLATRIDRGRIDAIERDGATWTRVHARGVGFSFTALDAALEGAGAGDGASGGPTADADAPVVEARIRGGAARSVSVFLNGRPAGQWTLSKGEVQVARAKLTAANTPNGAQLVAGTNDLLLRFNGAAPRSGAAPDEQAEIDWIHIGRADPDGTYGAPTRDAVLTSVTVGGSAKRSIALRGESFVRCSGWLPAGGRVSVALGVQGVTDADTEIRLLRDRVAPIVLGRFHLGAAEGRTFREVDLPIDAARAASPAAANEPGTLGALELVVTKAARGARVVFGEPRVVSPASKQTDGAGDRDPNVPERAPGARGVVLVVLGAAPPRTLALYGGKLTLPTLGALALVGLTFDGQRAPSSVASASFASMITGLSPRESGVNDDGAALPPDATTLPDVLAQAGIATAFFTAVPTTSTAFGYQRGWGTFAEHAPDADGTGSVATQVFDDASHWLAAHAKDRFFLVVHARGGHPPWDATADELKAMPPPDYAGAVDPKHAGELLGKARRAPQQVRLSDGDRTRAWALYAQALRAHDAAFERLLASLKAAGRDDDTMVMVTGDVGIDDLAHVPFPDERTLDESALAVPLVVRPPPAAVVLKEVLVGRRFGTPTTSADLAPTILDAFGLPPPAGLSGRDLFATTRAMPGRGSRPLVATIGPRYALRWGTFALSGARAPGLDRETKLCDLILEPACLTDVRGAFPLALEALHRAAFDLVPLTERSRTPAIVDPKMAASLHAWGE